mmetsp:Transcript_75983/g.214154  ORF Transcript_75983/g.214154 Transcript_75983/m.214154 type:complete len:223 (+) Transcript_75983:1352-2020(+)
MHRGRPRAGPGARGKPRRPAARRPRPRVSRRRCRPRAPPASSGAPGPKAEWRRAAVRSCAGRRHRLCRRRRRHCHPASAPPRCASPRRRRSKAKAQASCRRRTAASPDGASAGLPTNRPRRRRLHPAHRLSSMSQWRSPAKSQKADSRRWRARRRLRATSDVHLCRFAVRRRLPRRPAPRASSGPPPPLPPCAASRRLPSGGRPPPPLADATRAREVTKPCP